MITVVDHVNPWLIPRSTFAASTQFQRRRPHQGEWHRRRHKPARDQHMLAAKPIRHSAGSVVGQRLRDAEHDDERQDCAARRELKLALREHGQDASLEADHGADEGIHDNEQRELKRVRAKAQANGSTWFQGWVAVTLACLSKCTSARSRAMSRSTGQLMAIRQK